ncbi:phenylalanine--tRNA ligase subunit alpha [bacterium]|jgi:phenylalanyl-tRNA synthetase alpha chain|nr:phenylalanine--tRNA ligase subunit alpha [bacterium]
MIPKLESIGKETLKEAGSARTLEQLEEIRIRVLGKKGSLSEVLKALGSVSAEERPKIGAVANQWKQQIEAALQERKTQLEGEVLSQQLKSEKIDTTVPGRVPHRGSLHPITSVTQRIVEVLGRIGFDVMTGPIAETEFLNFEAVNIPKDHPARDMQDTFFLGPEVVLRTHTSSVQMRAMRGKKWPLRILCPGSVYRCDYDATHLPMFHQIEGLWVDKDVRMSDLKGTLDFFAKEIFGKESQVRMRPSYFPFVEPGAEVDVSCFKCKGTPKDSCTVCRGSGWLEILGCGMVHPKLFELAGYGTDVTGFAFGMGIERIAMLLHQIPDLRLMVQGDQRFLSQF